MPNICAETFGLSSHPQAPQPSDSSEVPESAVLGAELCSPSHPAHELNAQEGSVKARRRQARLAVTDDIR